MSGSCIINVITLRNMKLKKRVVSNIISILITLIIMAIPIDSTKISNSVIHTKSYFNSMISCPYSRTSYYCSDNNAYKSWVTKHITDINIFEENIKYFASNSTVPHRIFFIGNSHTEQLAVMLLCGLHELGAISKFNGTNLFDGCLMPLQPGLNCKIGSTNTSCGIYLSFFQLHNGAEIYLAYNHPLLFDGKRGLDQVSNLLGLDYTKLSAIVVGAWNEQSWAEGYFSPTQHNYVRPVIGDTCAKTDKPIQPKFSQIEDYIADSGFRGDFIAGGYLRVSQVHPIQFNKKYVQWRKHKLDFKDATCYAPTCVGKSSAHPCLPGYPMLVISRIIDILYNAPPANITVNNSIISIFNNISNSTST